MAETNQNKAVRRDFWDEQDLLRGFFHSPIRSRLMQSPWGDLPDRAWSPAVDVAESEDRYIVTVELPGSSKDDISLECHDNVLTIKGEKRNEREENEEHHHYVERSFGSFTRSFRMPPDASDDIKAKFRDGVLTVSVQKHEEKKPRVVSIDG
ncbi:MAG: Hsp20/alpha crystallin family protein [Deltaproteobacteria bacterium]|nr:Hsp20/alpha crystallin family protein [Deltaproteobacteria bacterium]MBW2398313.1 Hsp20/alpha crystallin family protein [Deltaproteobacteria bacterium]